MMCGNGQAAPWCLVLTGNTTAATESEAATLKLPDVAADVFPTIHPSLQEEAARLPHNTFFPPPFLDPAISSLACHPSTVHCTLWVVLYHTGILPDMHYTNLYCTTLCEETMMYTSQTTQEIFE